MTKANLPPLFRTPANPAGSICGLSCDSCFYLQKAQLYVDSRTRLDKDKCDFLRDNNIVAGLSAEAFPAEHDSLMRDLALLKLHDVDYQVLVSVNRHEVDYPLEVYKFFRDDVEAEWLQFIPVIERVDDSGVSDRSVTPEQWGNFLVTVFDEWIANDVGRTFVHTFEVAANRWMGNITGSNALPTECRQCDVLFACQGECPKNRFICTPSGEPGLNYLCLGYKQFYRHIGQAMTILAQILR